jgi:transcriptional regulator with XRE-family HTH domain
MGDPAPDLFGGYAKLLREVRGLTQEQLAERCGLSADTIRRLEHGEFSPSLRTLRKVARGFEMSVSQLFQGFDVDAEPDETTELAALVRGRDRRTIAAVVELTRTFLRAVDEQRDGNSS